MHYLTKDRRLCYAYNLLYISSCVNQKEKKKQQLIQKLLNKLSQMKIQSADQQVHLRCSLDTYLQTLVSLENILGKQPFCISSLLLQIQYNKVNDVCQPFFYNLDTILMAETQGFEPWEDFHPRRFSRPVH